jgi:hypothetical protein
MTANERPTKCPACTGKQTSLLDDPHLVGVQFMRQQGTSGFRIFARCVACNFHIATHGTWLPHAMFSADEIAEMPWEHESIQRPAPPVERCYVCKEECKPETHHLAPREMFGDECERWPTVRVCRRCHECWHNVVNLYQERKAAANA